jgi:hypothetical protein
MDLRQSFLDYTRETGNFTLATLTDLNPALRAGRAKQSGKHRAGLTLVSAGL